jgi:hypothetical protein
VPVHTFEVTCSMTHTQLHESAGNAVSEPHRVQCVDDNTGTGVAQIARAWVPKHKLQAFSLTAQYTEITVGSHAVIEMVKRH